MARARKNPTRIKRSTRPATRGRTDVEAALLALAQRVATIASEPRPHQTSLRGALAEMLTTYASHGRLVLDIWTRTRDDKRAALAVGWVREQVRLAVVELLRREVETGALRADASPDALAWLVVVVSESAVVEAAPDVTHRVDMLLGLLGAPQEGG